jgi:uncharacterized caspase-like protein
MTGQLRPPRQWLRLVTLGLAVALLALNVLPSRAAAADRVALVIGNSAYRAATPLKNPRNDADAIAAALERLNFKVIKGTDVDQAGLKAAVREFTREIEQAGVALFFYAGHGLQVNGRNFLIPVDASLQREADIDFEAMDLNFVLRLLERKDRTNIVFLDACRNNPLAARLASSMGQRSVFVGRGLARIETGVGTFIGFATQPDNVALDGEGANSPFTEALLKHIETPGLDIELLMRRVREDVIATTAGKQVPWSNSSLVGDRVVLKTEPKPEEAVAPEKPAEGTNARDLELALWDSVKESGNVAFLGSYLATYPNGNFAALARAMIEDIEGRKRAKAEPADRPATEAAPAVEQKPASEEPPVARLAPEAPEATPDTVEKEAAPAVEKKPVVKLDTPAPPAPRVKKAPVVEKKKKIEKPRVAKQPVVKKERVKRAAQSEPAFSAPAVNCGLCWPNGIKSFGRRRYCGVAFRAAIADGFCTP